MDLTVLGYNEKWIKYGFLTEEWLEYQLELFKTGEDPNTEHYRYATFLKWVHSGTPISDQQIHDFAELALEDPVETMGGSAVRALFLYSKISKKQKELVKEKLLLFKGDWKFKLIQREELKDRLRAEKLTDELFNACVEFKIKCKDNSLHKIIIEELKNQHYIKRISEEGDSKRIREWASSRLINESYL